MTQPDQTRSYNHSLQPSAKEKRFFHADPLVPFRGPVPLVRPDDPQQPEEFHDGKVAVFDLSDRDQLVRYNEIVNQCARGTAVMCKEEVTFSEKSNNYVVFVRWMERFYATVDHLQKESSGASQASPPASEGARQVSL